MCGGGLPAESYFQMSAKCTFPELEHTNKHKHQNQPGSSDDKVLWDQNETNTFLRNWRLSY